MALPGEAVPVPVCPDCGKELPIKVCMSGAGYYIGQVCEYCGPIDRLSRDYFRTEKEAQGHLDKDDYVRRDTDFHPGEFTVINLDSQSHGK